MSTRSSDTAVAEEQLLVPPSASCPACGCPTDSGDRFCVACGGETAPDRVSEPSAATDAATSQKHFRCENCGSEIATNQDHRSYTCPFCDSTYVLEFSPDETGR